MRAGALLPWLPALILGAGALLSHGGRPQREPPLRLPLEAALPAVLAGRGGEAAEISEAERSAAGMRDYLYRIHHEPAGALAFSLYVGYYDSQAYGRTIHSPKNCLPGSGWQALSSREAVVQTGAGPVPVNRYLLQNGEQQALVLYWYQGRGRVEANEYRVKWDLLRDAALRGRTEEALVRVLVPVTRDEESAYRLAARVAGEVIPRLSTALPS